MPSTITLNWSSKYLPLTGKNLNMQEEEILEETDALAETEIEQILIKQETFAENMLIDEESEGEKSDKVY